MDSTIEQQRAIYGTSLAERFGAVMQSYALSQRSLARVLGLSAPMLSQLMGGRRIKIGNPAVYGRLVMLEARAGEADRDAVLRQVEHSDPRTATQSAVEPRDGNGHRTTVEYLRSIADPAALSELAGKSRQLGAGPLADLLEQAAGSAT